jgi:predicted dehydrogenase
VIIVGWFIQGFQLKVELFGTARCVEARQVAPNPIVTATQMLATGTSRFFQPHVAELQHFVDCVTHDMKPSPSGEDGLKDLEAIALAYKNQVY